MTAGAGANYVLGSPTSATGTIADNDDPPVVFVEAIDDTGGEQGRTRSRSRSRAP